MVKAFVVGLIGAALLDPQSALEWVVLVGAAGTAWFWMFRNIFRPAAGAFMRTYKAVGALEDLPEFMAETRGRLEQGSENFRQLEQRLALAERAAFSVAEDAHNAAEHTQALVRDLDVSVRNGEEHPSTSPQRRAD